MVFLLLCELTRSAIYGSQKFDSHKLWPTVLVDEVKGKPCRVIFVWIIVTTSFYPCAFITNGYKRFSKTNSTDPSQRVPLSTWKVWHLKQSKATGGAGSQKIDCCSRSEWLWRALVSDVDLVMSQANVNVMLSLPVCETNIYVCRPRVAPNLNGLAWLWCAFLKWVLVISAYLVVDSTNFYKKFMTSKWCFIQFYHHESINFVWSFLIVFSNNSSVQSGNSL